MLFSILARTHSSLVVLGVNTRVQDRIPLASRVFLLHSPLLHFTLHQPIKLVFKLGHRGIYFVYFFCSQKAMKHGALTSMPSKFRLNFSCVVC